MSYQYILFRESGRIINQKKCVLSLSNGKFEACVQTLYFSFQLTNFTEESHTRTILQTR